MKKVFAILLITFLVCPVDAQSIMASSVYSTGRSFSLHLFLDFETNPSKQENAFHEMADEMEELRQKALKKHHQDTIYWLEKIFYKVQRKKLKQYKNYVSLSATLSDQKYDCVTGTAVYALLLEQLDIPYQIIEFPHHVSLLTTISGKRVMLESTDPLYGFVTDVKEIRDRIDFYQKVDDGNSSFKIIDLRQLAGLYFYNQAVVAYNDFYFANALYCVKKANALYSSERIRTLKYQIESIWSHRLTASH